MTDSGPGCEIAPVTVAMADVVSHLDETLGAAGFRDYCPNGLQVEGGPQVKGVTRVATGVSASMAFLQKAREWGAELVVVHHGLVWGPGISRLTGVTGARVRHLMKHDTSLAAYHLPLDAHPTLGNNAGLADALGLPQRSREGFGDVKGHALGMLTRLAAPLSRKELLGRVRDGVTGGAEPQFMFPHGPDAITCIGLCTGAASDLLEDAARAGCDTFITGELAERSGEVARELGVNLVAAGHYATEVFGPMRLAEEIGRVFPDVTAEFIDIPSPL